MLSDKLLSAALIQGDRTKINNQEKKKRIVIFAHKIYIISIIKTKPIYVLFVATVGNTALTIAKWMHKVMT